MTLSRNMDGDVILIRPGKSTMVVAKVGSDLWNELTRPIDMVLHCPKCHMQHVDAPEHWSEHFDAPMETSGPAYEEATGALRKWEETAWTNPPHRSHLCAGCGCVWRPADVPTNGVERLATRGKGDTWHPALTWPAATDGAQPTDEDRAAFEKLGREMYAMTTTVHSPNIVFAEQCEMIPGLWEHLVQERDRLQEAAAGVLEVSAAFASAARTGVQKDQGAGQ